MPSGVRIPLPAPQIRAIGTLELDFSIYRFKKYAYQQRVRLKLTNVIGYLHFCSCRVNFSLSYRTEKDVPTAITFHFIGL